MYRRLPQFDPGAEHIVVRPFLFNGRTFAPGESAQELPVRKILQLFEMRHVSQHPALAIANPPKPPQKQQHQGGPHGR